MRERTYWKNHILSVINKYKVDGSVKTITPHGTVVQEGTPQDADHFNSIEEGLSALELAFLILNLRYGQDKDVLDEKVQELVTDVQGITETIGEYGGDIEELEEAIENMGNAIYGLHEDIAEVASVEIGQVTLTNSLTFPFNNSKKTVAIGNPRDNGYYHVVTDVVSAVGCVGEVVVSDRLTNGFKLEYTGSASSVTIKYIVIGGWEV